MKSVFEEEEGIVRIMRKSENVRCWRGLMLKRRGSVLYSIYLDGIVNHTEPECRWVFLRSWATWWHLMRLKKMRWDWVAESKSGDKLSPKWYHTDTRLVFQLRPRAWMGTPQRSSASEMNKISKVHQGWGWMLHFLVQRAPYKTWVLNNLWGQPISFAVVGSEMTIEQVKRKAV